MGNDGGSIPTRTDLVKTKGKSEKADSRNQILAQWFCCALSKLPLKSPIVACPLGKLYNKDAVIEYLLDPQNSFGADGMQTASHLRSLKDVKELNLTPTTSSSPNDADLGGAAKSGAQSLVGKANWMCPISMREINGSVKFGFFWNCGCVISEAGLKIVVENDTCPVCNILLPENEKRMVILNPKLPEDIEYGYNFLAEKQGLEDEVKKEKKRLKTEGKKRKLADREEMPPPPSIQATTATKPLPSKRPRHSDLSPVVQHPQLNPLGKSLKEELAASALAVKTKSNMSAAVASLYGDKNKSKEKDGGAVNWLSRGTWTRYAA